ncbi:MAG: ABC transporter substrate-binding protein [Actinomycetota bacterium]|nr:ABC transporter substrate-binding protein [Actinomycetota bacterium]
MRVPRSFLVVSISAVILAACGPNYSAATPPSTKSSVTIGYLNLGADPQALVEARDWFSKYMHLPVNMREFPSGPAALPALASGSVQIMTGLGNPPVATAIMRHIPVKVVWVQERYTADEGLVVPKRSPIHNMKQLSGATIATVLGSTSTLALSAGLRQSGISPASVHLVNMTPPEMQAAWATGHITAAYTWDPFFDYMVQHGGRVLMTDGSVSRTTPIFNLAVANSRWAAAHRSIMVDFVKAEEAGVHAYRTSPKQAVVSMARVASISTTLAQREISGYQLYDLASQTSALGMGNGPTQPTSLVVKGLTLAARQLQSSTGTSGPLPNMADAVDPSFAVEAMSGK